MRIDCVWHTTLAHSVNHAPIVGRSFIFMAILGHTAVEIRPQITKDSCVHVNCWNVLCAAPCNPLSRCKCVGLAPLTKLWVLCSRVIIALQWYLFARYATKWTGGVWVFSHDLFAWKHLGVRWFCCTPKFMSWICVCSRRASTETWVLCFFRCLYRASRVYFALISPGNNSSLVSWTYSIQQYYLWTKSCAYRLCCSL